MRQSECVIFLQARPARHTATARIFDTLLAAMAPSPGNSLPYASSRVRVSVCVCDIEMCKNNCILALACALPSSDVAADFASITSTLRCDPLQLGFRGGHL